MKAIVINKAGGPEELNLAEVPEPEIGPDQLLVDVGAAGLNYIDTYHRSGLYPMDFPITPGLEGAGTVTAVGQDVGEVSPGDRVAWSGTIGSYAQRLVVPAAGVVPIPEDIDLETAAAVLLQGITAHYLATDTYPLGEGDVCLIHAGAGGVGLLLTQIAKLRGARVITTVGTDEKAELSAGAGADDVIVYTTRNFNEAVEDLIGRHRLDVVYDGVGKATFEGGIDLLRPRGTMVAFGNASGPPPNISPLLLAQKGSLYLTRPTIGDYLQSREELLERASDLFTWISDDNLHVRIGAEFPLAEAADAHRALEGRQTTGKVLLIP